MLVLYAFIGFCVGSFLNVVIDRIPAQRSVLQPPSHCDGCGRQLAAVEMIPLLSYLLLGGRCRTCGKTIPKRTFWVELITGALFACLWSALGPSLWLVLATVHTCILWVILIIDLQHRVVPNAIILPGIAFALITIPLRSMLGTAPATSGLLWWSDHTAPSIGSQLIGGAVAFGIFWLIWFISPGGMGAGDVKLAAFAGLITAFPGALLTVFGAFILGGLVAIGLLASGRATRKTAIPFAPFLAVMTFAMMIYGEQLLRWVVAR